MQNPRSCNQCGISLDGREGYVEIDPWEWAGPVTFETRVRYNTCLIEGAVPLRDSAFFSYDGTWSDPGFCFRWLLQRQGMRIKQLSLRLARYWRMDEPMICFPL